jgi:hypothetical protein
LLDRLSVRDRAYVIGECEKVELAFGHVLDEPGEAIRNVYFPTGSVVALFAAMGGKDNVEVSLAGNEGVYGVPVAFGVGISPVHAMVHGGGTAWRLSPGSFARVLARIPALRNAVNRYIYVVMSQLIRAAGCNRFHVVEQRLARSLLMTSDRAHAPSFRVTHEVLASMLGVRREGVTQAAGALQRQGLIAYQRGLVTILDRRGLERASCACYRSDIAMYDSNLG